MVTRAEALAAYGELAAEHQLAVEQMTPREQAEAAWSPTSRFTADQIEDLVRFDRGYPPLPGRGPAEVLRLRSRA